MFKRYGVPTIFKVLQKCPECGELAYLVPVKVGSSFKNLCKVCKAKYDKN